MIYGGVPLFGTVRMTKDKVTGLVVGTRKSGTTWLYENLRRDPFFSLSSKVKESGYFSNEGKLGLTEYLNLYDDRDRCLIEVDTSVCYSDAAMSRIIKHNPDMRVVIIFRGPAEWLRSRYTHSFRKGEIIEQDVVNAVSNTSWLRSELEYTEIVERFDCLRESGQLLLVPYELLRHDPQIFYNHVAKFLAGDNSYKPIYVNENVVNQSRTSVNKNITAFLSRVAIYARGKGLHNLVNFSKSIGIHKLLERSVVVHTDMNELSVEVSIIEEQFEKSLLFHKKLLQENELVQGHDHQSLSG